MCMGSNLSHREESLHNDSVRFYFGTCQAGNPKMDPHTNITRALAVCLQHLQERTHPPFHDVATFNVVPIFDADGSSAIPCYGG